MNGSDLYLAILVGLMFMAGIVLLVHSKRARIRTRKQWGDEPRRM